MGEAEVASTMETDSGLFARRATGLVRQVTPFSSFIVNFIPGAPVQALSYGLFFAFAIFPGGNFFVGGLLTIPLVLAFAYSFGLLTSMIPRTGGDYILVGRVLHPSLGMISSFLMALANFLSVAFFGLITVELGLVPGLTGIGLISGSSGLVDAAATIQGSTAWHFVIGTVMILLAMLLMSWGWKLSARLQAILLGIAMLGLLVAGLVALFMSKGSFTSNFNEFAQPFTNDPDSYGTTIKTAQEAGVNTDAGFSLSNTIPLIGIFAGFSIYSYFSSYLGGELRQARTMKTANTMALAGVVPILFVLLFGAIFLKTFGTDFMTAANGGGLPEEISAPATYGFLLSAATGSSILGWFLLITYLVYFPLICFLAFLQPVRTIFAYSFDGVLPKAATKLSRTHSPYVAVIITTVIAEATLLWAVNHSEKIFVILIYAILAQITAMGLVAIAAIVVPWRKPDLYRAGATTRTFAGLPVVTIAGIGGVLATGFLYYLYFHYPSFGLADKGEFFTWIAVTIGAAILYYIGAMVVRARQGVNLALVYKEIPPE